MIYQLLFSLILIFLKSVDSKPIILAQRDTYKHLALNFEKIPTIRKTNSQSSFFRHSISSHSHVLLTIENEYNAYVSTINIGNPPQEVKVSLDTGSSDTWVPMPQLNSQGLDIGSYKINKSTTATIINDPFQLSYVDRANVDGLWVKDSVKFSKITIPDMRFGLANDSDIERGVLGIGVKSAEITKWLPNPFEYNNFPYKLKELGYIPKAAYSLYLNSTESATGTVLFGAIDHAKYEGELYYSNLLDLKLDPFSDVESEGFYIHLDSVRHGNYTYTGEEQNHYTGNSALFDSGTSLIYAPNDVIINIAGKFGTYNRLAGGFITSCNTEAPPIEFNFGNKTIKIPFDDVLYPLNKAFPTYDFGEDSCLISILSAGESNGITLFTLGDIFLRSAYVVYDLESERLGIAQAKYTQKSDVKVMNS